MKTIRQLSIVTNREVPALQQNAYVAQVLRMRCTYGLYQDLVGPNTQIRFAVAGNIDFRDPLAVVPALIVSGHITKPDDVDSMTFGDFSDASSSMRGCIAALFA